MLNVHVSDLFNFQVAFVNVKSETNKKFLFHFYIIFDFGFGFGFGFGFVQQFYCFHIFKIIGVKFK